MNLYAFISNNAVNSYDVLGREDGLWGPNPNGGSNWVSLDGRDGQDYYDQGRAAASAMEGTDHLGTESSSFEENQRQGRAEAVAWFVATGGTSGNPFRGYSETGADTGLAAKWDSFLSGKEGMRFLIANDLPLSLGVKNSAAPSGALANGSDSKTGVGTSYLFEKGKRYLNVYDGKELDRGSVGYPLRHLAKSQH